MPDSVFPQGYEWMQMDVLDAEEAGYITHARKLWLKPEEDSDYQKGLVFDKIPEILTHGHVVTQERVTKMQERASVANYLILPTRCAFPISVRIHAIVFSFVTKCRKGRKILSQLLMEGKLSFQLFTVTLDDETEPPRLYGEEPYPPSTAMQVNMVEGVQGISLHNTFNKGLFRSSKMRDSFAKTQVERSALAAVHTDRFVNQALLYLYRKRTEEVKAFHKAKEIM